MSPIQSVFNIRHQHHCCDYFADRKAEIHILKIWQRRCETNSRNKISSLQVLNFIRQWPILRCSFFVIFNVIQLIFFNKPWLFIYGIWYTSLLNGTIIIYTRYNKGTICTNTRVWNFINLVPTVIAIGVVPKNAESGKHLRKLPDCW